MYTSSAALGTLSISHQLRAYEVVCSEYLAKAIMNVLDSDYTIEILMCFSILRNILDDAYLKTSLY